MRDLDDEKRIKEYMAAKMKHIKMYNECMNLADGLDVAKFAELVRADEREKCAKRKWVGLDKSDMNVLLSVSQFTSDAKGFIRLVEEKLKEKNT